VSCGSDHTVAIKQNGSLWGCGITAPSGTGGFYNVFTRVGTDTNWATVSAGNNFSVAVKTNGTFWAWGFNESGQLADGTTTTSQTPKQVGLLTNWLQVSAGKTGFAAGVKTDGTLWTWGNNESGQLGLGDTTNRLTHRQVGTSTSWKTVCAGGAHIIALRIDGSIYACGSNISGQLGQGTSGSTTNSSVLIQIGGASDWVRLPNSVVGSTFALKAV
jgi:alpha-tubulin suppressor-like RCC1 family protein